MHSNLEALIKDSAASMSEQLAQAADAAESEEDIRIAATRQLDDFIYQAGLDIRARHEFRLADGRIDSKFGSVFVEYKSPKGPSRIAGRADSPGCKAVVEQIQQRFRDLRSLGDAGMENVFGVGCDGEHFVFVRMRGGKVEAEPPQPVAPHSAERLLRAVVSVGRRGAAFTPENLAGFFGAESDAARGGVRRIYDIVRATDNPKALTFFRQWQILFGEVCGYDIHRRNPKVGELGKHYGTGDPEPAALLFAVHTYYAIFLKILAVEIASTFNPQASSTLKRLAAAPTSAALREELAKLEEARFWVDYIGVRNFFEGDIFAWYLDAWGEGCAEAVRAMLHAFERFDPATLSADPAESRDLLKQLYQQLFPRSVRHDLGEYYTPDWLAELVLDEMGYDGDPDKRLLDPACGSGTFLVMAINRVKAWYDAHRFDCGFGKDELLPKILRNIVGFDLNPLAVMAARTNFFMAIRDLLPVAEAELPVYLCDSIMTPSKYGDLFTGNNGNVQQIRTSAGVFRIPVEVTGSREVIGRYADMLEFSVGAGDGPDGFLERLETWAIPAKARELHKELYGQLRELAEKGQNGVWARIIKNAFAPLFVGKMDFVAGNPPWVNWESLPEDYRDDMKPLWEEYGLFTLAGQAARLGGGKKDLAMIFVYSAADNYLETGGKLGFVITQSVFKTQGAGEGFRRLQFSKNSNTFYLKPLEVKDLSAMQVFEGATNRTAVFVCEKRKRAFRFPVPYTVWRGPSRIQPETPLSEARALAEATEMGAAPIDPQRPSSPWLTAPKRALSGVRKVVGQSGYQAHAGCCTWLNGVYWIRVLDTRINGELLIENLNEVGKIPIPKVQAVIEPDLVYPLLRGRDVRRWRAEPSAHIILAQDPVKRAGIPEDEMRRRWPKTFLYLKQFEGDPEKPQRGTLRDRSGYRKYFKPTDPFYSMYNVGPYSMAKWKVVWNRIDTRLQASISGLGEGGRPVIAQETHSITPMKSKTEAHYFAASFNSAPCDLVVQSYSMGKSFGSPHVLQNLAIPRFIKTDKVHARLATLSRQCHKAAEKADAERVATLEAEIDEAAAALWKITKAELKAIRDALGLA